MDEAICRRRRVHRQSGGHAPPWSPPWAPRLTPTRVFTSLYAVSACERTCMCPIPGALRGGIFPADVSFLRSKTMRFCTWIWRIITDVLREAEQHRHEAPTSGRLHHPPTGRHNRRPALQTGVSTALIPSHGPLKRSGAECLTPALLFPSCDTCKASSFVSGVSGAEWDHPCCPLDRGRCFA